MMWQEPWLDLIRSRLAAISMTCGGGRLNRSTMCRKTPMLAELVGSGQQVFGFPRQLVISAQSFRWTPIARVALLLRREGCSGCRGERRTLRRKDNGVRFKSNPQMAVP